MQLLDKADIAVLLKRVLVLVRDAHELLVIVGNKGRSQLVIYARYGLDLVEDQAAGVLGQLRHSAVANQRDEQELLVGVDHYLTDDLSGRGQHLLQVEERRIEALEHRLDAAGIVEIGEQVLGVEVARRRSPQVERVVGEQLSGEREVLRDQRQLEKIGVHARQQVEVELSRVGVHLKFLDGRVDD